jgi:hypothetical protein
MYDIQTGAPFLAHEDRVQNDRFIPAVDEPTEDGYDALLQVWRQEADGTVYDTDGQPVAVTGSDRDAPIQGNITYDPDAAVDNPDTAFGLIEYMGGWDRQYREAARGPDILLGFPEITVHSDLQDAHRLLLDERTVTDDEQQRSIDSAFEDGLREKLGLSADELAVTTYDATLLKETDAGVEPFMDLQERDLELLRPLEAYGDDTAPANDLVQLWEMNMDAAATTMRASADMYAAYMDLWLTPFNGCQEAGYSH